MSDDLARQARRYALQHAMTVLGTAAQLRDAGTDERALLHAASQQIFERGIPGEPGSAEYLAGADERAMILANVEAALAGANESSGYGPLTWLELLVQDRLARFLF